MAATVSLFSSFDPHHRHPHHHSTHLFSNNTHFKPHQTLQTSTLFPKFPHILHKSHPPSFKPSSLPSHSPTTATTEEATTISTFLEYPLRTRRFLSSQEREQLQLLENFRYHSELETGSMWVRVMRPEEMDVTVGLLAESFAESMLLPSGYVSVLAYLVKQYVFERMELMPHTATLIGFYRNKKEEANEEEGEGGEEFEFLAGTLEISFDKKGANASPPTPTPPKDSPYISNMAVKKSLRRRGIGWHLLNASEELISQMSSSREVYLHCRIIDTAPFNMYKKAGYDIVKTDNLLVLFLLQRRKHLMCKKLPALTSFPESDALCSEEE